MQCRYLLHKHILVYNSMERVRSIDNHRMKGLYDSVKKWYCFVFVSIVYPSDDLRVSTRVKVIIECYYNAISVFKNKSKELSNTFLNSWIKPSLFQFIWQWMCCVVFSCIVCDWTVFLVMSFVYWKCTNNKKCCPNSWVWESSRLFPQAGIYSYCSSDTIHLWLLRQRVF